jgi:phage tail sheath protein FI
MTVYVTPGVYRTTPAPAPPPLSLVRTDICGFVGYAERGPVPEDMDDPDFDATQVGRRVTSWAEFQSIYGSFLPEGNLAPAVRGFFENGGDACYVVRVAATRAALDQQPLAARYALPSGPPVALGALTAAGTGFTADIAFAAAMTADHAVGAFLRFRRAGLDQVVMALGRNADGGLLLAEPLDAHFAIGDAVELYPTAASFVARSRGGWGNRLRLQLTALDAGAFGLIVTVDLGPGVLLREQEIYPRLTPSTATDVLATSSNLVDFEGSGAIWFDSSGPLASRTIFLSGGRDGIAATKLIDFSGAAADRRGLRLLEDIDEIGIVAIPDAVLSQTPVLSAPAPAPEPCTPPPPQPAPVLPPDPTAVPAILGDDDRGTLQMLMVEQCERLKFRIALIDPPGGMQPDQIVGWPQQQGFRNSSTRFAALYYPWLDVSDPTGPDGSLRRIPPSGHVAGAMAHVDLTRGVQQPPANIAFAGVVDVAQPVSDAQSGLLNNASVNAIRVLPGRGIRIWGARSLAAVEDADWRFVHVRRLMSAIEETALRSSRWATFETNDDRLRLALSHSMNVLLEGIWDKGGLKGAKPSEAFYVRCDDTNNPQAVIDAGQVVCQIGVAVAAPMEFIVFDIRQDVVGGAIAEQ